jgi:hypothetical protein
LDELERELLELLRGVDNQLKYKIMKTAKALLE